jgi:hypothetical protein
MGGNVPRKVLKRNQGFAGTMVTAIKSCENWQKNDLCAIFLSDCALCANFYSLDLL